jgi:hypothetical protein
MRCASLIIIYARHEPQSTEKLSLQQSECLNDIDECRMSLDSDGFPTIFRKPVDRKKVEDNDLDEPADPKKRKVDTLTVRKDCLCHSSKLACPVSRFVMP